MSFLYPLSSSRTVDPNAINPARSRMSQQLTHNRPVLACRFDPSGQFVFAGAQDFGIHRWNLSNGNKTTMNGHQSWARALAFVPNPAQTITGAYDGTIIWWSTTAENPTPIRTVEGHNGWVRSLAVSPDGCTLASCGNDGLVKLWNTANGNLIRTLTGHERHVYNVAFHPGGEFLVSGDLMGRVKQWNVSNGEEVRSFDAGALHRYDNTFRADIGGIRGIDFNADGSLLACAGITNVSNAFAGVGNPAVLLFDWQTGQRRQILRPRQAFRGTAWGVRFHPEGFLVAAGGGSGGAMWFWRPTTEQSFATVRLPNNAYDLDLHRDGFRMAIPFYDNKLRVYDLRPNA